MNRFDAHISDYLFENKEAILEKIGTIKIPANFSAQETQTSVVFTADKKAATTPALINFIAEKEKKNKFLIASDIDSHLSQVREFINIGKNYEIPNIGFIKVNNSGVYEFLPYAEVNKSARITSSHVPPSAKPQRNSKRSFVQVITLLIVLVILGGLGYEAYQFFIKKPDNSSAAVPAPDTTVITPAQDTLKKDTTTTANPVQAKTYSPTDIVSVRYIFETTASGLRARTRTQQLIGFHNNAGYDSFISHSATYYNLFILRTTPIADTTRVRDSISKFLQKDIKLEIEPVK